MSNENKNAQAPNAELGAASKDDKVENRAASKDDKVEVFIPKGFGNEDPNYFVSVNGVNYVLPRGKTSRVPAAIAAEINRARKAQEKQDENVDKMLGASK